LGELALRARDVDRQPELTPGRLQKHGEYIEPGDRPFPFDHVIYFGDGDTDIPAMKMVRGILKLYLRKHR
jgi:fructosamine-3-kinase